MNLSSGDEAKTSQIQPSCHPNTSYHLTEMDNTVENLVETKPVALFKVRCAEVAFTAAADDGADRGPFNTPTTLVYNKEITNIGGAYNKCTGIFVAPVAGVYYFTFFFHAGREYGTKLSLFKNCDLIATTTDHKSCDVADNGGNAAVVQLEEGDEVYVRMAENSYIWADGTLPKYGPYHLQWLSGQSNVRMDDSRGMIPKSQNQ